MRNKLVAGNWKMNGSLASNGELLQGIVPALAGLPGARYAVCVPFPYLGQAQAILRGSNIDLGAQDVCRFESGAYTGGVSAAMLQDFACRYAIVGHSERRQLFGEDDAAVSRKTRAALRAGLRPIVCIGETLAERDAGQTLGRVGAQLDAALAELGEADVARCLLAYEPVWAIGTGRNATPEQAEEVHRFIRGRLADKVARGVADGLAVLYGGSVKPENIGALMGGENVDGALVGGASLSAASFVRIVKEGTDVWSRS